MKKVNVVKDQFNKDGDIVEVNTSVAIPEAAYVSPFDREINGNGQIQSYSFRRQLTRNLIAMAHRDELYIGVDSEMYIMDLPAQGRTEGTQPAFALDGIDLQSGEEVTLICNVMIVSALQRSGYQVVVARDIDDKKVAHLRYSEGNSIKGHAFGMKSGQIKAGKAYRTVNVIELEKK